MLKFSALSLRRGPRELLHDVNMTIHRGEKIALTGANGCGKSSLFSLLRNELQADNGEFSLPAGTVIAHVAQETEATSRTAIATVLDGDTELRKIEKKIADLEQSGKNEALANLYARLEAIDGYTAPSRAACLLHGLGFTRGQEQMAVREFSGGWRMRLNLAQALMCRSDLLLLDEPTNHLDLDAVLWLEEWLFRYPGTLLLISHDRDFIDRIVDKVAHIEQSTIRLYSGNYSAFELRRAEQLASQQAAYERQQRERASMHRFVERFKAKASKAKQAQSRIKALERMEIITQAHVDSPFNFIFKAPNKRVNPLLQIEEVSVGYNDKTILSEVILTLGEGDRIGLLGKNGAGKSTLIKLLADQIAPTAGQRIEAKGLSIGYFAQHQLEQLDDNASPLEHLQRLDKQASEQELRNYLGGFAFNGDMATNSVAPFSGGEKARLVLALIVYQRPHLLLLDEPTNHLDLEMRHALTTALQGFTGALVVVSHDRHLLRTVADTLILVADGRVRPFDGDLEDYHCWLKEQEKENSQKSKEQKPSEETANKKQQRQQAAESRRLLQPLQNKLKQLEENLNDLHAEQKKIHNQMLDSTLYDEKNKDTLSQLLKQQGDNEKQVDSVENLWLAVSEELEQLK